MQKTIAKSGKKLTVKRKTTRVGTKSQTAATTSAHDLEAAPSPQQPQPAADAQPPALQQPVQAAAPKIIYVSFSAEIVPKTSEALLAVLADQVNQGVRTVYLMLSTPGGSVMHGLNLYNVLRALPIKLITHNVGNVDSIGNAIFLAGDERYACPHSTFMFHGVGFDGQAGLRLEEKMLRERLGSVLADQKRIGAIMRERTSLDVKKIRGLFRQAQTKDAAYARTHGIIDDIRDVQITPGAPVLQLVFQR